MEHCSSWITSVACNMMDDLQLFRKSSPANFWTFDPNERRNDGRIRPRQVVAKFGSTG